MMESNVEDMGELIALLQDNYAPYLQAFYHEREGFYFLQDGAPSHTSQESEKVLNKIFGKNKWIQNPPNSPDLNVLDYHTWNHMDQFVQKCDNIKTLSDLKREVVRSVRIRILIKNKLKKQ